LWLIERTGVHTRGARTFLLSTKLPERIPLRRKFFLPPNLFTASHSLIWSSDNYQPFRGKLFWTRVLRSLLSRR
jgi:hypothetical protein